MASYLEVHHQNDFASVLARVSMGSGPVLQNGNEPDLSELTLGRPVEIIGCNRNSSSIRHLFTLDCGPVL